VSINEELLGRKLAAPVSKSEITAVEGFTAVTMKKAVFWNIKPQFVPHRRHITSPLQCPAGYCYVRFEVFTTVTMKNVAFWDVTPCGLCKNISVALYTC
jgi:hypothetical protein